MRYTDKAKCPLVATAGSVGSDLFSAYKYVISPLDTMLIKTDLQINIPTGYYGLISGRSSVALVVIQTHVGLIEVTIGG